MSAHVFVTPKGDEMVILPKAEYEALLEAAEDAADVAAYDAAKADLEGSKPLSAERSAAALDRHRTKPGFR